MSERDLRETYQAIIGAVSAGDDAALDQLIATDLVDHNPVPGQASGRTGFKYWMRGMHEWFSDLSGVVEDTVMEGDKVAARVTWRGTHRGVFMGIPGTGAPVEIQAVHIVQFADGRAAQWWGTADVFGALAQMGARVVPSSKPA